jgi:hypothetical protein
MAIKIIKRRNAPEIRPPAELVEDAPVAEAAPAPVPEAPKSEELQKWEGFVPAHNARAIECKFCHQHYLKPCIEEVHGGCLNFQHLQKLQQAKEKRG